MEFRALAIHYLNGEADDEEVAKLEAWILESPENALILAKCAVDEQNLPAASGSAFALAEGMPREGMIDPELLEALMPRGPLDLIDITDQVRADEKARRKAIRSQKSSRRGRERAGSDLPRVIVIPRSIAWLASAAAVLLIAAAVFWHGSEPKTNQPIADNNTQPPDLEPITPRLVAMLTAEHDAVWDRRPGTGLYAGQRLTLTKGFVQITTQRGAVAALEAPATIELIDSPNAIRLHTGKLVGICETESSKGFLVRTPHMDVIDIGTRFGVDATNPGDTKVLVIRGEIEVSTNKPGSMPIRYTQEQAVSVNTRGEMAAVTEPLSFTQKLPMSDLPVLESLGALAYFPFKEMAKEQVIDGSVWAVSPNGSKVKGLPLVPGNGQQIQDSAYTISLWLKPGSVTQNHHVLSLTTQEGPSKHFSNQIILAQDGRIRHYAYEQKGPRSVRGESRMHTSRSIVTGDDWTHIAVSGSAKGEMRLYINGVPDADPVAIPWNLMHGTHYVVGGPAQTRAEGQNIKRIDLAPYQGGIKRLALFGRQLTDNEVKTLYDTSRQAGPITYIPDQTN
ncbi:MAG: LamG-like jellyroll fold domain-containing protein [Planctomycetota bacterium]